jgi:hypothetical protein
VGNVQLYGPVPIDPFWPRTCSSQMRPTLHCPGNANPTLFLPSGLTPGQPISQ